MPFYNDGVTQCYVHAAGRRIPKSRVFAGSAPAFFKHRRTRRRRWLQLSNQLTSIWLRSGHGFDSPTLYLTASFAMGRLRAGASF